MHGEESTFPPSPLHFSFTKWGDCTCNPITCCTVAHKHSIHSIVPTVKPPYSETSDKGHYSKRGQTSQQRTSRVYTLCRKSPLKENNLSTKDKMAGPIDILIKWFHCTTTHCLSLSQQLLPTLASSVLPQPGGPESRTPGGVVKPRLANS